MGEGIHVAAAGLTAKPLCLRSAATPPTPCTKGGRHRRPQIIQIAWCEARKSGRKGGRVGVWCLRRTHHVARSAPETSVTVTKLYAYKMATLIGTKYDGNENRKVLHNIAQHLAI